MSTPRTETIVLAANASQPCYSAGKFMAVKSCTVASFEFAFGTDGFQAGEPYCTYPSSEPFDYVRFRDSLGGGATIVVTISDEEPQDNRGNRDELEVIATSLNNIDVDTSAMIVEQTASNVLLTAANVDLAALEVLQTAANVDLAALEVLQTAANVDLAAIELLLGVRNNPLDISPTVIVASGAEVQIVTGAANSRVVNLHALDTNAGDVWLRLQTGVTNLVHSIPLHPGDWWREEWSGDVFACSENGTEALCGYVTRI